MQDQALHTLHILRGASLSDGRCDCGDERLGAADTGLVVRGTA